MRPGPLPWVPITATAPAHRLWVGGGPAELGCLLPGPGPGREAAAGQRGPAAGAQAGQRWGDAGGGGLPAVLSYLNSDTGAGVSPQAGGVSVGRDSASASLCLLGWPRPCSLATGHQGPGTQGPPGRPCHHTSPRFPRTSPALPTTPHPRSSQHTPLGFKALAPELTSGRVTTAPRP